MLVQKRPPRARARSAATPCASASSSSAQRVELRRLAARRVRERLRQQPVREPRVPRQQRPVEVRADGAADAAALEAALAVVAEAVHDAAERQRALVEQRAAGVVLESGERPAGPLAVEQDVADHAALARDRVEREEADPGQLDAVAVAVVATEQLVAAADGEDGRAAGNSLVHGVRLRGEVDRDERLLAILAAADVQQVVRARAAARPPSKPRRLRARARARQRAARARRCCRGRHRCSGSPDRDGRRGSSRRAAPSTAALRRARR